MKLHTYLFLEDQLAELDEEIKRLQQAGSDLPEVQKAALWRSGDLRWKLHPHQRDVYDRFTEWNLRRHTPEYRAHAKALLKGPLYSLWVEEIARRFGKTWKWLVILFEFCIKNPGSLFTYATAAQKDIGGIVVPLAEAIAADAPDDVRPEYHPSKGEVHEGLFFPSNGSVIKLVGIDVRPKALRGHFSDGVVISEAGHVEGREQHPRGLEATVRGKILPQFQRRPHAFLALESSSPEDPAHDFLRVFRPDAEVRGAYVSRTIDDNTAITDEEREQYIDESGGRGHRIAEREYYNKVERDPARAVVPEFNRAEHVRKHERPPYALCVTAADPGAAHLFGLVFGYYDFLAARGIVEWSWAKANPSYREVACVIAWAEWRLWGRWPDEKLAEIPVDDVKRLGWKQLLASTPATLEHYAELARMAAATGEAREPERWRKFVPEGHFGFWNGREYQQNPIARVSDVDKLMIRSLQAEYGVAFTQTAKDHAIVQINNLRDAFGGDRISLLPTAGPVIDHTEKATKKEGTDDWEVHPVYGHFDALAAEVYFWRNLDQHRNPYPPAAALATAQHFVPPQKRTRTPEERMAFGDGNSGRKVVGRARGLKRSRR
ncbi:MAG TPA: hypothetical protein VHM19_22835 [Polyangiales bacterium]|jgi:hypothetical protein|nr:hypothetical protein [Polyangiales bacterium]